MAENTSNYFDIFVEDTVRLVRSFIIKNVAFADRMNRVIELELKQAVNKSDKTSWRYYKHLAGEYHDVDEIMTVISADTSEVIEFTKENLFRHTATARAYQQGSDNYLRLIYRYPSQRILINGILKPINIHDAIEADDWTLMGWDSSLVEGNESSLIHKVQSFIRGWARTWVNIRYGMFNPLYDPLMFGMLGVYLVPKVMEIRLSMCKTHEAHSFHIRQYLTSMGVKDKQFDRLNLKQRLLLYRNLLYIRHYAGHNQSLKWLTDVLMTMRNLPLVKYDMEHSLKRMPEEADPTPEFKVVSMNLPAKYQEGDIYTVEQLLDKEEPLVPGNEGLSTGGLSGVMDRLLASPATRLETKVIESKVEDYTGFGIYNLQEMLLNHWVYLSGEGYYKRTTVVIDNHLTGEQIPLNVRDAFILYLYCYIRSEDYDLQMVPSYPVVNVRKVELPTPTEMNVLVNKDIINPELAGYILGKHEPYVNFISVDEFYSAVKKIYDLRNSEHKIACLAKTIDGKAMIEKMTSLIYTTKQVKLVDEPTYYRDWLLSRNIDLDVFTTNDYVIMMKSIFATSTGIDINAVESPRSIQEAMLGILSNFSSYSIQTIRDVNESDYLIMIAPTLRGETGDNYGTQFTEAFYPEMHALYYENKTNPKLDVGGVGTRVMNVNPIGEFSPYSLTVRVGVIDRAIDPKRYQLYIQGPSTGVIC